MEERDRDKFKLNMKKLIEILPNEYKEKIFTEENHLYSLNIKEMWLDLCNDKEKLIKAIKKIKIRDLDAFEKVKAWATLEYFNGIILGKSDCLLSQEMNRTAYEVEGENLTSEEKLRLLSNNMLNQLTFLLNSSKIFNIGKEIKPILESKIKLSYNEDNKLPYPMVLLDLGEINYKNLSWFGIILSDCSVRNFQINGKIKEKANVLKIFLIGRDNLDNEPIYAWDYLCDEGISESYSYKDGTDAIFNNNPLERKEFINNMFKLCLNFLNLLNCPEVELITTSNKVFREARNKKDKFGIPDKITLNLTGKLKRYISETISNNEKAWEVGYRFWVRGHWVEFKDERYKSMKGKKVWVANYIKGKGELINKEYCIGEEQCWENQKRMVKIIQSIFLDKKIEKNNRTALDGLEIDCYIPELKLGFEYNGQQHYEWVDVFHKTEEEFKKQLERDIEKNKRALEKGIRLITIKYDEPLTEEHIKKRLNQ